MVSVVTGGCGFIGSHMVDRLLAEGHEVRVVDNFSTGRPENLEHQKGNPNLSVIEADICDTGCIRPVFEGAGRVFHFAALADIVPSIQRPEDYFHSNVDGTFSVLQCARNAGVKRFLYTASSSCYGIPERFPTDENAEIRPEYPYALTKRMGEELALVVGRAQTVKTAVLHRRLKRRRQPFFLRFRRLRVVMAVKQHCLRARLFDLSSPNTSGFVGLEKTFTLVQPRPVSSPRSISAQSATPILRALTLGCATSFLSSSRSSTS